jgi:hypothetical protein
MLLDELHRELDRFGHTLGSAKDMPSAIELFKLGHHEYSTKVGGILERLREQMSLLEAPLPDKVKDSLVAYLSHFYKARNIERVVMEHGSYNQQVECIHAFLADLSVIKNALTGGKKL